MTFETIEQWIEAVPRLFHRPVAAGLNGVFQFELGDAAPFHIAISPTAIVVTRGPSSDRTMTVSTSVKNWLDVVNVSGNAGISELVERKTLTLTPFDPELLKWVELVLRSDRSESEQDFRKILVGSVEFWPAFRGLWKPFLESQGLVPAHHLLDLGCGTLRVGAPLIGHLDPGHYVGVDVREEVLPEARREIEAQGLTAKDATLIHCTDLRDLEVGRRFDVVLAGSVLVNLADEILDVFLGAVNRHLATDGAFYANVNIAEHVTRQNDEGLRWLGYPWVVRSMQFYREIGHAHGLEVTDLGAPSSEFWSIKQQRIIRYKLIA